MLGLPDDALLHALLFLPGRDLASARELSRRLRGLAERDLLWQEAASTQLAPSWRQIRTWGVPWRPTPASFGDVLCAPRRAPAPGDYHHIRIDSHPVFTVHLLDDEHVAWTSADGMLRVERIRRSDDGTLDSSTTASVLAHEAGILGAGYCPEEGAMVTSDFAGHVKLWKLRPGKLRFLARLPARELRAILKERSPSLLAGCIERQDFVDRIIRSNAVRVVEHVGDLPAHVGTVVACGIDGGMTASCGHDGLVRLSSASDRKQRHVYSVSPAGVDALHLRIADQQRFAAGTKDSRVCLCSAETGAVESTFATQHGWVWAINMRPGPTSSAMLTAGTNGDLALFDVRAPAQPVTHTIVSTPGQPVAGLDVRWDECQAITAGFDGIVRVWDMRAMRSALTAMRDLPHASSERLTRLHATFNRVATGCFDGSVHVWDTLRGGLV